MFWLSSFGATAMTTLVLLAKEEGWQWVADARNGQLATHEYFLCLFHVVDAGADESRTGLLVRFFFHLRQDRWSNGFELDKIF